MVHLTFIFIDAMETIDAISSHGEGQPPFALIDLCCAVLNLAKFNLEFPFQCKRPPGLWEVFYMQQTIGRSCASIFGRTGKIIFGPSFSMVELPSSGA